jgi:hypothetical protein
MQNQTKNPNKRRNKNFVVSVNNETFQKFKQLSEATGFSVGEMIRISLPQIYERFKNIQS